MSLGKTLQSPSLVLVKDTNNVNSVMICQQSINQSVKVYAGWFATVGCTL